MNTDVNKEFSLFPEKHIEYRVLNHYCGIERNIINSSGLKVKNLSTINNRVRIKDSKANNDYWRSSGMERLGLIK